MILDGHPIWGGVNLAIGFLPGIEWHSKKSLKGQHRLSWFLSCLFFPLTIITSRFLAIFVHGNALRELNLWMNGPRNQWGRGLLTSLLLFRLWTVECKDIISWGNLLYLSNLFLRCSWMAAEQVLLARQERANR